jgi:hypothetical protein
MMISYENRLLRLWDGIWVPMGLNARDFNALLNCVHATQMSEYSEF